MNNERILDSVGLAILRELQQDGRMSFSELGRRIGLTPPAAAERVRRLEEAGVIAGYRAEVNLDKIGFPITAIIRITTHDNRHDAGLAGFAQELPGLLECHRITGVDCYVLKVALTTIKELESIIDVLAPYGRTTTSIVTSSPVTGWLVASDGSLEPANLDRPTLGEILGGCSVPARTEVRG